MNFQGCQRLPYNEKVLSRLLPLFLALLIIGYGFYLWIARQTIDPNQIRYVAIGDSYTYGQGAIPGQNDWPTLLTQDLKNHGLPILLVQNLGHDNWNTQQAIDLELPIYKQLHPTFATLMIGANDWAQLVPADSFRQRFSYLLDQMLTELPSRSRIIVLTIPSYDTTPYGIGKGLARTDGVTVQDFNKIINDESQKRGVTVLDLFPISQAMSQDPSLLASDQLHPSAKEYKIWEQLIYPVAFQKLSN